MDKNYIYTFGSFEEDFTITQYLEYGVDYYALPPKTICWLKPKSEIIAIYNEKKITKK
jgi:hypothetical protein